MTARAAARKATKVGTVPGNKKNAMRAEPAVGTTNVDLTRTTPLADPRFQAQREETSAEEPTPRLGVSGSGATARVTVPYQKLPELAPLRGEMPFETTPRSRT